MTDFKAGDRVRVRGTQRIGFVKDVIDGPWGKWVGFFPASPRQKRPITDGAYNAFRPNELECAK